MIYITSDTHFMHGKDFLYGPRGFSSAEEMSEAIVSNWNSIVSPDDTVYHLGDVILTDTEKGMEYLKRLNGNIMLIRGNHDSDARMQLYTDLPNVIYLGYANMLKYKHWLFYLSHYPTLTSNLDDASKPLKARVVNLCGHSHTKNKWADIDQGLIYHVELDAHNNYPVLLDDIIKEFQQLKNNEEKLDTIVD